MKTTHHTEKIRQSLRQLKLEHVLFVVILIVSSIWYLSTISTVPFHPDESTYLFSSDDITSLLSNPSQVFWEPGKEEDRKVALRMLDAPLRRYTMEFGRLLSGKDSLPAEWDWSKTWQENKQAGAYPDSELLLWGRISIAIFFPFSMLLIYLIGCRISNPTCGLISAVLFSSNGLILLHTRRAMAEGILIFTILLVLWSLTLRRKHIGLIALTSALAFCAKQSAGILFVVGMIAIIFDKQNRTSIYKLVYSIFLYHLVFCIIVLVLNPFMWKYPVQASIKAYEMRNNLLEQQVESLTQIRPDLEQNTFAKRVSTMLIQVFFKQPDIADVGNYLKDMEIETKAYESNKLNNLSQGMITGALSLTMSLYGFLLGIVHITRNRADSDFKLSLIMISGVLLFITFGMVITLPYQRYFLPMVPFTILWIGYACGSVWDAIYRKIHIT